ncbi:MAG: hypothetical protein E7022_04340 [Desulfovibrio desulfuricans]|nr:hypothetical protein [Desulfovibrio desulfuricans]
MLKNYKSILAISIAFIIILLYSGNNYTIASEDRWRYVGIDSTCSFKIPSTIEIQSKMYNDVSIALYKKIHPNKSLFLPNSEKKIICQQNGLNDLNEKARKLYVRIIFEEIQSDDILPSLHEKLVLTNNEINELVDALNSEILMQAKKINMRLTSSITSSIANINGMDCIYVTYKRTIENNPEVIVRIYTFFNRYVIDRFTVSYRATESHLWENDLETVINSLKITER